MSSQIFPTLAGLGWSVKRTPLWKTRTQESVSGKRTRTAFWSYPRWRWELGFDVLRQGALSGAAYSEFAQLAGFFNARQGAFDSFLYQDADDNGVTGQVIATADGTSVQYQLVRSFGGFVEPVLAPRALGAVYLDGVPYLGGNSLTTWGSGTPGLLGFGSTPPAAGKVVSADFTYYWPCAFDDDALSFEKFMAALYAARSVTFSSLK
jgi:uncharacterized protein (TIGR02217 family)